MSCIIMIEKLNNIISFIHQKGYLYYFLKNFSKTTNGNIQNLRALWMDITRPIYKKNWFIQDDQLCFQITDGIYYNLNLLTFNMNQEEDHIQDFFHIIAEKFCIHLHFKNIQSYINVTKDEYKKSWIIDKNKAIVYFKFRNLCGEGAMKKTYLGWNITTNKPIVVYQINVPYNQIEQKRYLNEKKIGELGKSPYLLHIHYSFSQREYQKVFMISDYIKYSIKNLWDSQYIWSINELKIFAKQILRGLKDLHDLNIIHRDIKPGNILFDKENQLYKIIDFGIATKYNISSSCIETINHYKTNEELSLVGTVGYIAPEMYKSLYNYNHMIKYNNMVDVFSFGVVLLEMITNQRAFSQDLEDLSQHLPFDLQMIEQNLNLLLRDDYTHLKIINNHLEKNSVKNRKYEKVKIEIQEKIELIQHIERCEQDERSTLMEELNDKNKSIIICCKKLNNDPEFTKLDKKTNEEHSLILQVKELQNFMIKIKQYEKKSTEEKVNDLLLYPILFMSANYTFPKLLDQIEDELLKDFLKGCLHKNEMERKQLNELLNHKWLQ